MTDKAGEGLKLGVLFALVNFVLDLLVLVLLFKTGFGYFASLTVWLAYCILVTVPCLVGRSLERSSTKYSVHPSCPLCLCGELFRI